MEQKRKFLTLSLQDRFRFLYAGVKENEKFMVNWIDNDYPSDKETRENAKECILNAFDFLGKLLLPGAHPSAVENKELMLNGMADDLISLSEEVEDLIKVKNVNRFIASTAALEALFTCVIDCFFSPEGYDEDNCPLGVILLSALGNYLQNDFAEFTSKETYGLNWSGLAELGQRYPSIEKTLGDFMDKIFNRTLLES